MFLAPLRTLRKGVQRVSLQSNNTSVFANFALRISTIKTQRQLITKLCCRFVSLGDRDKCESNSDCKDDNTFCFMYDQCDSGHCYCKKGYEKKEGKCVEGELFYERLVTSTYNDTSILENSCTRFIIYFSFS